MLSTSTAVSRDVPGTMLCSSQRCTGSGRASTRQGSKTRKPSVGSPSAVHSSRGTVSGGRPPCARPAGAAAPAWPAPARWSRPPRAPSPGRRRRRCRRPGRRLPLVPQRHDDREQHPEAEQPGDRVADHPPAGPLHVVAEHHPLGRADGAQQQEPEHDAQGDGERHRPVAPGVVERARQHADQPGERRAGRGRHHPAQAGEPEELPAQHERLRGPEQEPLTRSCGHRHGQEGQRGQVQGQQDHQHGDREAQGLAHGGGEEPAAPERARTLAEERREVMVDPCRGRRTDRHRTHPGRATRSPVTVITGQAHRAASAVARSR